MNRVGCVRFQLLAQLTYAYYHLRENEPRTALSLMPIRVRLTHVLYAICKYV